MAGPLTDPWSAVAPPPGSPSAERLTTEVRLPEGSWRDALTSRWHGRRVRAAEVFADLPVALLELEAPH